MRKNRSDRPSGATLAQDPIRRSSDAIVRYRAVEPPPILATDADDRRFCGIRYNDCHLYFDTVKYFSKSEIGAADQAWLRSHCGRLDIRTQGQWTRAERGRAHQIGIWPYLFRIEVHQPDCDALAYFAKRRDISVRAVHIARDFTFDSESRKLAMLGFFTEHFVQRWQRKRDRIIFADSGISTGRRSKGSYFTAYISKPCRIDGVWDCFHGEMRHLGTKALTKIGIYSAQDLLHFDHTAYWRSKDAECLKTVDKRRLGRYQRNRASKSRDQHEHVNDLRIGGLVWRKHAADQRGEFSVQQFIRTYSAARVAKNIIGTVDTEGRKP